MFWSSMTSQGKSSQVSCGNHRHLRSVVARQTAFPRQGAHGQQRIEEAESLGKHTSRTSMQTTVPPWVLMSVPWRLELAVMFAV